MKIGLIGCFPPPIGGISAFNANLYRRLRMADFTVQRIPTNPEANPDLRGSLIGRVAFCAHAARAWVSRSLIVHVSDATSYKRIVVWTLLAAAMRKRFLVTFHNLDYAAKRVRLFSQRPRYSVLERALAWLIRASANVVVVNEEMKRLLVSSHGFRPSSVRVIPAFLDVDDASIFDPDLEEQVKGRYVIAANAWISLVKGRDIYGVDQIVDLAVKAASLPDILIVVFLVNVDRSRVDEREYFERLAARQRGLPNLTFYHSRQSLQPLLKKADLFIRPTLSDGDALSVREALRQGLPVIASDAVGRPAGVITYRSGDVEDLWTKVREVRLGRTEEAAEQGDFFQEIVGEYERLSPRGARNSNVPPRRNPPS